MSQKRTYTIDKGDNMLQQVYSQYVINFEENADLIDYINVFKEKLAPFFNKKAYTVVGLPDSVPVPSELPRIIAVSSNGHSSLEVNLRQICLNIKFDDQYWNDFDKCYQYMKKRISILDEVAMEIANDKIFFNGIVTQFVDEQIAEPTAYILQHMYREHVSKNHIFDVLSKLTYVKDEVYYINTTINNARKDLQQECLGVQLDINSRYWANYSKESKYANRSIIQGTMKLYHEVVMQHLAEIEKGELAIW